jgi:RNA polymerase subunit RPABC4/transcription elongation factor Spt4
MKELNICPICGTKTEQKHSSYLQLVGLSKYAKKKLDSLWIKNGNEYIYIICPKCASIRKIGEEWAWLEISGTLWGWVKEGDKAHWRISQIDRIKVKVQFT